MLTGAVHTHDQRLPQLAVVRLHKIKGAVDQQLLQQSTNQSINRAITFKAMR